MKTCQQVAAGLDRVIDGEVNSLERLSFALHMAMCGPCERYFRQYKAVRAAAVHACDELPDDFTEVMSRVVAGALANSEGQG